MTDVPYEVALGLDLERKVDWVGGVMTHVLHAGPLAGCRKNCRSRLAALMAELLPCGVVSTERETLRLGSPGRVCGGRGARRGPLCGPSSGRGLRPRFFRADPRGEAQKRAAWALDLGAQTAAAGRVEATSETEFAARIGSRRSLNFTASERLGWPIRGDRGQSRQNPATCLIPHKIPRRPKSQKEHRGEHRKMRFPG